MKNLALSLTVILSLASSIVFSQIEGSNAFLFSEFIEIGIHANGYEGSSVRPTFSDHWRGGPSRIGFMANPSDDGWTNYDGDYYLPGSPQNDFGIQIDGTDYKNGATGSYNIPVTEGLHDYAVIGKCKVVEWDGSVAGIDIHLLYKLDTTVTYYTVDVTITNTNPVDKNNIYFYKTFDPDNNQSIGWGFDTYNRVVHEPDPFCPKSLVYGAQYNTWDNYVGLAAVDPQTRVSRGDFSCFGSCGSNIWNAVFPHIGVEEVSETYQDRAISICHKDNTLEAGASSNFQFVVILDEEQVEEAIQSLYFIDYPEGPGTLASCTTELIDVDMDGDLEPVPDTVDFYCTDGTIDLSLDGPYLGIGYEITWYNEDTGEEIGEGADIEVASSGATMYKVVADPVGDCFDQPIERYIVVRGSSIGPNINIADLGPQCSDVPIEDLTITDELEIPGTFIEFYEEYPEEMYDPDGIWDGSPIGPDDVVWVLMGDPEGGCYDIEEIIIEFIEIDAGLDSTGFLMCNSGLETADLNTFLVDTVSLVDESEIWEEVTPTGGAFDAATGIFDPTDVVAGDYTFRFIVSGGDLCDNDTSLHTITVYHQPDAGEDNTGEICNQEGFAIDLNTLLTGHEPGGVWSEIDATGGAFNTATGVLTIDGVITPGDYRFEYTLVGTEPCIDDVSEFTVTIHPLPVVDAGPDQSICIGDETSVSASGDPATYDWDPDGIVDALPFTPDVGTLTYTATATDANGCVSQSSLEIVVHPLPVISFVPDTLSGCTPMEITYTISSSEEIVTTDWTFGDGDVALGLTSPTVSHTYLYDGLFNVGATVTDIYGCVNSIEYSELITIETQPIAAFTMSPQSVFTSDTEADFTNESLHASDYIWDFGDGSDLNNTENPKHFFPDDKGDVFYPVTLTSYNYLGCTDVATLYMNVKGIILYYIPNTFTPDGDQFNETFQPVFESGFDPYDFHMVIYNRWGEVVFETYDATKGWNGLYGNQGIVKGGVYTWYIDFKARHSDKRYEDKGHVILLD